MSITRNGDILGSATASVDHGSITAPAAVSVDLGGVVDLFPTMPGLKWDRKRKSIWKTLIRESVSGKEARAGLWSYPRLQYSLSYEFLRVEDVHFEWQILEGFFHLHKGSLVSFLYLDPMDNAVIDQLIGRGGGGRTDWQMVRTFGQSGANYLMPVKHFRAAPTIYVDGVVRPTGWSIDSNGLLSFDSAPDDGTTITADIEFYWPVRFVDEESEFSQFMYRFFENQKVELITLK